MAAVTGVEVCVSLFLMTRNYIFKSLTKLHYLVTAKTLENSMPCLTAGIVSEYKLVI